MVLMFGYHEKGKENKNITKKRREDAKRFLSTFPLNKVEESLGKVHFSTI